jgi:hypothetical protein
LGHHLYDISVRKLGLVKLIFLNLALLNLGFVSK